jgi:hypothetical protein
LDGNINTGRILSKANNKTCGLAGPNERLNLGRRDTDIQSNKKKNIIESEIIPFFGYPAKHIINIKAINKRPGIFSRYIALCRTISKRLPV